MQLRKSFFFVFMMGILGLLLQELAQPSAAQIQATSHAPLAAAAPPSRPAAQGPFVGSPVPAFSFNGDVRRLSQTKVLSQSREAPQPLRRQKLNVPAPGPSAAIDPVRQAQTGTRQSPTPLENFAGLSSDGWYPPDPNGDVGPNHYVQAVNVEIGIYSKTGTLLAALYFDTLFSNANSGTGTGTPCDSYGGNRGDPIALYDATVDRWLIADFAWSNSSGPFYECIAYSKTGDPVSGGWNLYPMSTGTLFPDYPKFGVWSDGIYMSANIFLNGSSYNGPSVWALNRSELSSGATLHPQYFSLGSSYGTVLPANLRGSTLPPSGEPAFFASIDEPSTFHLWKFHVDWSNSSNSTFTGPTNLTVANFVMPCNAANTITCVPELNGESVDSLGDRLMMQLQYRNIGGTESLWANHTVAASASTGYPTGIRWYEIRDPNGSPFVYQQGTYMPNDSTYRWMGSLAVDGFGNMALGYSRSSMSMYPSIAYAGRLVTDTLGTLPQAETTLVSGTGSQSVNCGGSPCNRWGDYSAMTIDPTDDCTFWYTNEYYVSTGGDWQTRIGSFRLATKSISSPPPSPNGTYLYYLPFIAQAGGNGSVHCY